MVVAYPSSAEGSCWSFLTTNPRILFWWRGSAVPNLFPQLVIIGALSAVALHLQENGNNPFADMEASNFQLVGTLLSFFLVFKTQNAYGQFWKGISCADDALRLSRSIAMCACSLFDWDVPAVQERSRRIVRLLVLYFFVIMEYFQRTGANATKDKANQDKLRDNIRALTGENEFGVLYPSEDVTTTGSQSKHSHANPSLVIFWIHLALGRIHAAKGCPAPIASGLANQLSSLMQCFYEMEKIDKTQFPLPYAQIVKILVHFVVFILPFNLASQGATWLTPILSMLAGIGFFGMDEVSEILESPFGCDANDIELDHYARKLVMDMQLIYHCRNMKLDKVLGDDDDDIDFSELLTGSYGVETEQSMSALLRARSGMSETNMPEVIECTGIVPSPPTRVACS